MICLYIVKYDEGLTREQEETGAKMKTKVLVSSATKTKFGMVANNVSECFILKNLYSMVKFV